MSEPTAFPDAGGDPAPRRRRWPRILAAIASAAILVTTLAGLGVDYASTRLEGNITAVDISDVTGRPYVPPIVVDEQGNYTPLNILLMGSDTREGLDEGSKYGDPSVYGGQRSDTTILLHLAGDRSLATAVSIPRDTWVTLPQCPRTGSGEPAGEFEEKFNIAFEIGGPGCTVKLVEQLTGLTIDHFAVVDFTGFKNVVDALGGVEVCLTEAVKDPQSKLDLPAGTSVVNGEQALGFVRARKTIGDGSDIGRIKRQQAFLSSMIREASSTDLLLNPVQLYSVLDAATGSLTTDPGFADLDVLQQVALSVRGVDPENITFLTMPWYERGDGENVVMDDEAAASVWASMRDDVPWLKPKKTAKPSSSASPEPSPTETKAPKATIEPALIAVRVLNGSGVAGRAAEVAAALEAQGFQIVAIDDADRNDYTTTEIRHDAPLAEAARTVLSALPKSETVADETADVITIVVGSSYTEVATVEVVQDDTTSTPSPSPAETVSEEESKQREDDEITAPTTADKVKCG
ncbi:MAG: LCP family protein [bacterium]